MYFVFIVKFVVFLLSVAVSADPSTCPSKSKTACPSNTTCCNMQYSRSGFGCCHLQNAVCCNGSSTILPSGDAIQNCCPRDYTCINTGEYSAICVPPSGSHKPNTTALHVCTPGPQYPPNDPQQNPHKLPSCIIIGDSVSIGHTPYVKQALNNTCFVQHSPWASGGGAADTKNGLNCIEEFLRTSNFTQVQWDLIFFNFGLHNLHNDTSAELEYKNELTAISDRLVATKSKIVYGLTTPMMTNFRAGNKAVEDDNKQAVDIMTKRKIPIVDLYKTITSYCGAEYIDCDICARSPCAYHYKPKGYQMLAAVISKEIKGLLTDSI